MYCLKDAGITIQTVEPDFENFPFQEEEFEETDPDEVRRSFLKKLYQRYISKIFRSPKEFSSEWLEDQINHKRYRGIKRNGTSQHMIPESLSFQEFESFTLPLIAPYFFTFTFKVNQKNLKKAIENYMQQYQEGKLHLAENNYFSYERTDAVVKAFLKRLADRQRTHKEQSFRPKNFNTGKTGLKDDFLAAFAKEFPDDFTSWKEGLYELPLIEHLICLELAGKIKISGISIQQPQLSGWDILNTEKDETHEENYREMVRCLSEKMDTQAVILFDNHSSKNTPSRSHTQERIINLIEVEKSSNDKFVVYLNQDYLHPVRFSKRNKTGQLIYNIARKGKVDYSSFARQYEYIQTDRKFKLFAQTDFVHILLLTRKGKKIVPNASIVYQLIERPDPRDIR